MPYIQYGPKTTYLNTLTASTQAGLSQDRIRVLAVAGRIHGAIKIGKAWLIPANFAITRNGTRGPKGKTK